MAQDKITSNAMFGPTDDGMGGKSFATEGLTVETNFSDDRTIALKESGDVQEENLKYGGLVAYIKERYERARIKRWNDEQRWLRAYKNYRGIYDSDVQFTKTEKSRAFIKITKTKILAAQSQIMDILLSGNKFPIGVQAQNIPVGDIESAVHVDPQEKAPPTNAQSGMTPGQSGAGQNPLGPQQPQGNSPSPTVARQDILDHVGPLQDSLSRVGDKLEDGPGLTPTSYTWEPAKEAAKRMDKKMQDQLEEANASKSLQAMVFEMCTFGHGIYKGPFALDKEYPRWDGDGTYNPVIKQIPDFSFVSIWDAYPDADAVNMDDAETFVQRHRMSKTQLRALKKRPFFRDESIELAIAGGFNYIPEYWENAIKDYQNKRAYERYEVLEFWGVADKNFIEFADMDIPGKLKGHDQVQINAWICNGEILRLVFNPFTPARIPYYAVPYELNPYSFFGIGVGENMEDTQLLMNGFIRMAVDNAVLSSNVVFEINETGLSPGQSFDIYPGKVFRTQGQLGQSIHVNHFESVMQECLAMFDKARQLADEATGMPSFAHGQTGVQGTGRTASGMSMLMGAAKDNIKAVIRNIDDYLLVPLGKALFAFNMQFDFDKAATGDLEVVALGTESLMRNEIRSQKIMQFLQLTSNPMDAPFAKRDYLLRELAESLDIEADLAVNDPREAGIQAMQIQALMQAQGIDPNGGGGAQSPQTPQGPGQQGGGAPGAASGATSPPGVPPPGQGDTSPGSIPLPGDKGFSASPQSPGPNAKGK